MEGLFQFLKRFERFTKNTDIFVAVGLLSILAVMIIPLPPMALDLFLTFSLALSLLILLVAIYVTKALDFSVFSAAPFRYSRLCTAFPNIATTRLLRSRTGTKARKPREK